MRVIGYVRVSTRGQGESGLSLEAQKQRLAGEVAARGWELTELATEIASAKDMRRPVLRGVLDVLDAGGADALMFTRLDRCSRSLGDFAALMARAERNKWALVMLDPAVDMSTPFGRAMAGVAATFAQLDRELIAQRTREGLAVARARGTFDPGGTQREQRPEVLERIRALRAGNRGKLSHRAIARRLTLEGVPAPQGGAWDHRTVGRILNRMGVE